MALRSMLHARIAGNTRSAGEPDRTRTARLPELLILPLKRRMALYWTVWSSWCQCMSLAMSSPTAEKRCVSSPCWDRACPRRRVSLLRMILPRGFSYGHFQAISRWNLPLMRSIRIATISLPRSAASSISSPSASSSTANGWSSKHSHGGSRMSDCSQRRLLLRPKLILPAAIDHTNCSAFRNERPYHSKS